MDNSLLKNLVAETQAVKKLLVLQLLQNGASQKQIAAMLEISEATMSRMIPKGSVEKKTR